MCIGANMAFRKEVFDMVGGFDTALDVGTPSHGGGDIEIFHRIVANNFVVAYEPSMLIWHYHRREWKALRKQIFDNGRSFGCYLINCYRNHTASGVGIIRFFLIDWLLKWNLKNLLGINSRVPRKLSIAELMGMFSSPYAYLKTKAQDMKLRRKHNKEEQGKVYKIDMRDQMKSLFSGSAKVS
jgi:hypothetical protein